jgi:LPXTG-motif cell wall-anchored protein
MKKIIGIVLAVLMMFSMGTMAFAGTETYVPTENKGPDYVVTVDIAGPTMEHEETDTGTNDFKCYVFTVKLVNNTKTEVEATDFDISVRAYGSETEVEYGIEFDYDNANFEKNSAHSSGGEGFYTIPARVNTNANLYFEIAVNTEDAKLVTTFIDGPEAMFELVEVIEEEPSVNEPDEPIVEPDEPNEPVVEPDEPNYDIEDETGGDDEWVDEEIPNTGSSKAVGGFTALGVAAIAALVIAKKKKSMRLLCQ